jgi:hypothetical protein
MVDQSKDRAKTFGRPLVFYRPGEAPGPVPRAYPDSLPGLGSPHLHPGHWPVPIAEAGDFRPAQRGRKVHVCHSS